MTTATAERIPASATSHPLRRNTITPKILIKQEVKTPSHVPKSTGWDMKKLDFHQGL